MKKIFLSLMLMLGAIAASAQENGTTVNVFKPHMYVQLQGGAQYTLGERPFNYLISPNAQIALGYQFNPVFGLRLSVNGWQSKAGIDLAERPKVDWKWNYVAPTIDATFNLSNIICGYNPNRVVNWSVFAGVGANVGFKNDEAADAAQIWNNSFAVGGFVPQNINYLWDGTKVRLTGKAGTMVDFRISDAVSVGVEVNANVLNDRYNSKNSDNLDWYFNALAGVKINLGKTHTTKFVPAPEPKVVEKIVERIVEKPVPAPVAAPAPVASAPKREAIRREVFFDLCSAVIKGTEGSKVQEIADYLKKYPEAKVSLIGYADKGTGNASVNASWAAKRVEAVKNELVNKYGISAGQISTDSKGDTIQPFAENDKNRVTICIAE